MSDPTRMAEAEVSLRLAFWLLQQGHASSPIRVAIDGAQVRVAGKVQFDLIAFLKREGWRQGKQADRWQCRWTHCSSSHQVEIHSNPGCGDVLAPLKSGHTLRVECKKGPLARTASSPEYPLIREALGQLLTISEVNDDDILAVAVSHSARFADLAERWRQAPLIQRLGIRILTVDRSRRVFGFEPS